MKEEAQRKGQSVYPSCCITASSFTKFGRDVTLLTKIRIVKTMVFPVVLHGCESWALRKAEHSETCFLTVVLEKTLESPLDSKEIKPVNPKGNQP